MSRLPPVDMRGLDAVCSRYGIAALEVFGSAARGESGPEMEHVLRAASRIVDDANVVIIGG